MTDLEKRIEEALPANQGFQLRCPIQFCYEMVHPASLHYDEEPSTGRLYLSHAGSSQHTFAGCTEACEEGYRCAVGHWLPVEAPLLEMVELEVAEPPAWLGFKLWGYKTLTAVGYNPA